MKVYNIYVTDYLFFIDGLLRTLSFNNINYVFIKNNDNIELHFNDNIFIIYSSNKDIGLSYIHKSLFLDNNFMMYLDSTAPSICKIPYKKEQPGLKRYTKKYMKKDNRNNRLNKGFNNTKLPRR